jgi:ABC-type nitrate/sulfonate/bicarbonate transport system substrate-binding protein
MNVFESHQKRIALATLKLHKVGASVLGGMTHQQAVQYLKKMGMSESSIKSDLEKYGHSPEDVAEFMKEPA